MAAYREDMMALVENTTKNKLLKNELALVRK